MPGFLLCEYEKISTLLLAMLSHIACSLAPPPTTPIFMFSPYEIMLLTIMNILFLVANYSLHLINEKSAF